MKKICFGFVLFLMAGVGFGQSYIKPNNNYGMWLNRLRPDSTLLVPTGPIAPVGLVGLRSVNQRMGAIYVDSTGGKLYWFNPKTLTWSEAGGGGSIVEDSVILNRLAKQFGKRFDIQSGKFDSVYSSTSTGLIFANSSGASIGGIGTGGGITGYWDGLHTFNGGATINGTTTIGSLSGILKASTGIVGVAVSGTDLKTVNGNSIIGSGDIIAGTTKVGNMITATDNKGAIISNDTIYIESANATLGGALTNANQDILGVKRFLSDIRTDGITSDAGNAVTISGQNGNTYGGNVRITTSSALATGTLGRSILGITGDYSGVKGQYGANGIRLAPTINRPTYVSMRFVGLMYEPTVTAMVEPHAAIALMAGDFVMGNDTARTSAIMDINSTTKGILIPRMTAVQAEAIVSPAEGLLVYVNSVSTPGATITTKGWWGFDGTNWVKLN